MSKHPDQHEILHALGERIATLRKRAGLTQNQLCELSELDVPANQRAESGRAALSFEWLTTLSACVGMTLPDLHCIGLPFGRGVLVGRVGTGCERASSKR